MYNKNDVAYKYVLNHILLSQPIVYKKNKNKKHFGF